MAGSGGESSNPYAGGGGIGDTGLGVRNGITEQSININQKVGTSDITLFTADEDKGGLKLPALKSLRFTNKGNAVIGVQVKLVLWEGVAAEDTTHDHSYLQFMVKRGETINFPMSRIISSTADGFLAGTEVDNTAPNSNMYTDSTADVDHATASTIGSDATHTTLNL